MHRKALVFGAGVLAFAGTVSIANAQVLACEDFSYADGSLVPNGCWSLHSGTADTLLVSGGQVVVQHGAPSEDAHIDFSAVPGNIYFGLDFSVDDLGAPVSVGDTEYFAHFREGFNFSARLDIVPPTGAGDFSVGIASDDSTADAIWPADLTFGITYHVVVRYDQDANIAELWIDPTAVTDTSILGDDKADPGDSVVSFALRQSDSADNETVRVDNVTVGRAFSDNLGTGSCSGGTQTTRFSSPPNPGQLNCAGQPNIGTNWNPSIISPGSAFDVLIISPTAVAGPGFLCTIPGPGLIFVNAVPATPFSVAIPNVPALVGVAVCSQGGGLDATFTTLTLTNALDLVIGG